MMLDVMLRKPWRQLRYARELADLHDRLHAIAAPDWLPALDDGDRFLHLDLHPMNVMLTANGPVVIDWPNAARGDALSDVAVTFVLLTCPEMPGSRIVNRVVHPLRVALARAFASRYEGTALDEKLVLAAQLKALDRNLTQEEVAACERLEAKARARLS
jgi:aminoglycoside phosphotransferase (APT) family kinase protein